MLLLPLTNVFLNVFVSGTPSEPIQKTREGDMSEI